MVEDSVSGLLILEVDETVSEGSISILVEEGKSSSSVLGLGEGEIVDDGRFVIDEDSFKSVDVGDSSSMDVVLGDTVGGSVGLYPQSVSVCRQHINIEHTVVNIVVCVSVLVTKTVTVLLSAVTVLVVYTVLAGLTFCLACTPKHKHAIAYS
jgi:hypothetical protein